MVSNERKGANGVAGRRVRHRFGGVTLALMLGCTAPGAFAAGLTVLDDRGNPVADAAVGLTPLAGPAPAASDDAVVIDQKNKRFVPEVSVVGVGGAVRFPNSDDIRHHVYSFSRPNDFELPLYSGEPANPQRFEAPGKVVLGCNIHDRMRAYLYVLEAPLRFITPGDGTVAADAAPGRYKVEVFHPNAMNDPATTTELELAAEGTATVTIALRPKAEAQPSRELSDLEKRFLELRNGAP